MDHDFYEWASEAPMRTPDGFSEAATAAGVAASVAERNEMLAYALKTFGRGHAQLLGRILAGYEKAKRLQIRGMIAYAVVAALALAVVLALPLSMDTELRVIVWVPSRFLRTFRQPPRPALRCGYPSSSVTSR